jgi:2-C-methyl-D-erythritol 2,4-cyclodiphosphate synthase
VSFRIGQGFDVHRFSSDADRPLVLGGVTITGSRGLEGHSDADVVCHALADAVLGAAGLGDLGTHFPDTDGRWAGADSTELLATSVARAADAGFVAVSADCTVVAEAPRLAPHTAAMAERLTGMLSAPVSVKATRAEGLGALGRAEGVACLAVVLLETRAGTAGAGA